MAEVRPPQFVRVGEGAEGSVRKNDDFEDEEAGQDVDPERAFPDDEFGGSDRLRPPNEEADPHSEDKRDRRREERDLGCGEEGGNDGLHVCRIEVPRPEEKVRGQGEGGDDDGDRCEDID